jgi:hypothetical protein
MPRLACIFNSASHPTPPAPVPGRQPNAAVRPRARPPALRVPGRRSPCTAPPAIAPRTGQAYGTRTAFPEVTARIRDGRGMLLTGRAAAASRHGFSRLGGRDTVPIRCEGVMRRGSMRPRTCTGPSRHTTTPGGGAQPERGGSRHHGVVHPRCVGGRFARETPRAGQAQGRLFARHGCCCADRAAKGDYRNGVKRVYDVSVSPPPLWIFGA